MYLILFLELELERTDGEKREILITYGVLMVWAKIYGFRNLFAHDNLISGVLVLELLASDFVVRTGNLPCTGNV